MKRKKGSVCPVNSFFSCFFGRDFPAVINKEFEKGL